MNLDKHALVLIDLQRRIVARETHPYPAADVVARAARLAAAFRRAGQLVIAVRAVNADVPDPAGDQYVDELAFVANDLLVTKHSWGAFYGTSLDWHLRRKGATGIVLAGLMTNFGVESTARAADDLGYGLVFAEDAMASVSDSAHAFAVETIFPRLGTVASTEAIIVALLGETAAR